MASTKPVRAPVHLSVREIAVIRWTAMGKTAAEIAMILNVTERTVKFHISNATKKLDASNKTAAAVRATAVGLI